MPARRNAISQRDSGAFAMLADPQADLFFTLVAVMLPAILLLLPAARMADDAPAQRTQQMTETLARAGVNLDGVPAQLFIARADGVAFGPDGATVTALDAVQDDPALRAALSAAALRQADPPLLLIEPGGEEAAFLFETLAAAYGPDRIAQVRLERGCAGLRGAAAAACPR